MDHWEPSAPRRARGRRLVGWLLIAATIVAAAGGVTAILQGRGADDAARRADADTARLARTRRTLLAAIDVTNHAADTPIGKAEQVANALSRIDEVTGNVFIESRNVTEVMGRAVRLENTSGRGAGRSLYEGDGSDAVRKLQAVLQGAQVTLAAAVQADADLQAIAP